MDRYELELLKAARAHFATQKEMAEKLEVSQARLHRLLKKHRLLGGKRATEGHSRAAALIDEAKSQ
jgi:hypothetical protein